MGCIQLMNKVANLDERKEKNLDEYDKNVAVDYALQNNK